MINRKIEIFLIIVGIAIFLFFGVSGVSMITAHNDPEGAGADLYVSLLEEIPEETPEEQEIPSFDQFIEQLRLFGITILVISAVAIILGVVAMLMIKNNKQPKIAGFMLLTIGIFIAMLQFGIAIIGSLAYVVAGVMAVFRKPKVI